METPMNQVPPQTPETVTVPPAPEAAPHMSPLMVTIIIGALAVLVLAFAYFSWTLREKYQAMIPVEVPAMTEESETTSSSDEVAAIEADVAATDLEEMDAEMAAMDAELESFEAELYAE